MSYLIQAKMAKERGLIMRIAACAAGEGVYRPTAWADANRQRLMADPEWVNRWADAIERELPNPGEDEAVITDELILAGVLRLLEEERAQQPVPEPEPDPAPVEPDPETPPTEGTQEPEVE